MNKMTEKIGASIENGNPYKALNAYQEADQKVFFGREEETERLFQLVRFNSLTVVFGKSGMGKTSLLNAGLFPRLRKEDFRPIRIRLNFTSDVSLKEQIRNAVEDGLAPNNIDEHNVEIDSQIDGIESIPLSAKETLWEYFRRVTHFTVTEEMKKKPVTPVLVFDQFEEIFTIGKDHKEKNEIIDELYWLVEDQFPPDLTKQALEKNDKKARMLLYSNVRPRFKVILSLREDYLPHLNGLKDRIPSIDRASFRVINLNGTQARDVIQKPGNGFKEEKTIQSVLHIFYKKKESDKGIMPEEELEIEPAFLSLLCYRMFEKGMFKAKKKEELEKLIEDYYDSTLKMYSTKVHAFIESKLLTEGGFRTPRVLDVNPTLKKHIDRLVEQRILRKFHVGHNEYVEIVHDLLTPIIEKRRNRRKQRKNILIASMVGAVIIVLIYLTFNASNQKNLANKQYNIAQANRLTTEALLELEKDNTKAIRIAEAAIKLAKDKVEPRAFEILGKIGYSSYNRPFYISITPLKPDDVIYSAAFSADSKSILTAHDDGTAQIRDLKGNLIRPLEGHKGRINTAVFSPDDTLILTASSDFTVRLWNREGNLLHTLPHDRDVICASFSPDGKLVLTASMDNTVRLWSLEGKEQQVFNQMGRVVSASFSPDGNFILTGSWDNTAKLWDRDGNLHSVYNLDDIMVTTLFSPNGKFILAAGAKGTIKLWDRENKQLKAQMIHEGILSTAAFSLDGHSILTAAEDGSIKLWDVQGNQKAHFDKHSQMVRAVAFSPDGRYLFTSSHGESAIIWDLRSNILVNLQHDNPVSSAEFSQNGKSILTLSRDGVVSLWNRKAQDPISFRDDTKNDIKITTAHFLPKTNFILTVSNDGTIKRWDDKGQFVNTIKWDRKQLNTIVISEGGTEILTLSVFKIATLWSFDGESLRQVKTFEQGNIVTAVFAHDGNHILTATQKGQVVVWDLSGKFLSDRILPINDKKIKSADFSPENNLYLTNLDDGTAALWDSKGNFLANLLHDQVIYTATFSPDGKQVLTASLDQKAKLWDLQGNLLATFEHEGAVFSATFSPDGRKVVTASRDDTARVWITPHSILLWLKNSKIPTLSKDSKRELRITLDESENRKKKLKKSLL